MIKLVMSQFVKPYVQMDKNGVTNAEAASQLNKQHISEKTRWSLEEAGVVTEKRFLLK